MNLAERARGVGESWTLPVACPRQMEVAEGSQSLMIEIAAWDGLGCEFDLLTVSDPRLATASVSDLHKLGEQLARRLTYLLEPIHLIEVDAEQGAQLRSSPPEKTAAAIHYYELCADRRGLALQRFQSSPGGPRTTIPAQVTRQVLWRLVGDLSQAASG